jgi:hypothetical protein
MSPRTLDLSNPEDAIWISCPECDVLPGDKCKLDPDLIGQPGYDKAVHQARLVAMYNLNQLEQETA